MCLVLPGKGGVCAGGGGVSPRRIMSNWIAGCFRIVMSEGEEPSLFFNDTAKLICSSPHWPPSARFAVWDSKALLPADE